MHRPIVWIPGAALLAVAIAALLAQGATREPAAGRSAPRVVVRSPSQSAPTHEAARELGGPGAPEVVVLGDLAPTRAPAPAPRGATSRPRVVHEIVYVDAAPEEPAPLSVASPEPMAVAPPAPEVAMGTTPAELPSSLPTPPPVQPAPRQQGSSRAGGIVTGAAIGAGIGAILGGSRGALRGAIGGAAGGAIGGRGSCRSSSVYDYASLTP